MKHIITGALLLGATLLSAQEKKTSNDTPVTVRIKKVEKVDGVEKISDTTYTINGTVKMDELNELAQKENEAQNGKARKMVIVTNEVQGDDVKVTTSGEISDEQVERAMKEASKALEELMTVDVSMEGSGTSEGKKITKIVILKTVKIVEPSAEDAQLVSKETGLSDGKLSVENMQFYPNPSSGKFNLDFNLPDKGNTDVTILNMEGKAVYSEELKGFTGRYKKEIDISENPKGVYFVRVKQGEHSQLKKIVLE